MKLKKLPLLAKVAIAISCGIALGQFMPPSIARVFVTFNSLFGNFLIFSIPLIILGFVIPAISELGKSAGKLLAITALIAYGSTLFTGFFSYFSCSAIYPEIIGDMYSLSAIGSPGGFMLKPYFVLDMPPVMDVMTSLLLAFTIGLGVAYVEGDTLRKACVDGRDVIVLLIDNVIIPLLPLHIFGIFLNMAVSGQALTIISMFIRVIIMVVALQITVLIIQFCTAGFICKRNPIKLMKTMLPAYLTGIGTQSSAATIPVTLAQTKKNGVREEIANFTVPLCATIHLSGSTTNIVACSLAILMMTGIPTDFSSYAGFIFILGITMVAAPGVPGGAMMAALGILHSMLGMDETGQALMMAIYVAIDCFGTACNVTGDGAIALVVDKISANKNNITA